MATMNNIASVHNPHVCLGVASGQVANGILVVSRAKCSVL